MKESTVAVIVPAPPEGFAWEAIAAGDGFRLRLQHRPDGLGLSNESAAVRIRDEQSFAARTTEIADSECPPCKLLLNSGGLIGLVRGINRMIKALNLRGLDLDSQSYAMLQDTICGAHDSLEAIERDLAAGPFVRVAQRRSS